MHALFVNSCSFKQNAFKKKKKQIKRVFINLSRADLDVKVASLIGDFEDFWPGEAIDPEAISVDEQTVGAHAEHYVDSL